MGGGGEGLVIYWASGDLAEIDLKGGGANDKE